MSTWLYINLLFVIIIVIKLSGSLEQLPAHIGFGLGGLMLAVFNWTRHAVFSTIRNSNDRKKKIRLANISKKILPYHRWTGTAALLLIGFHAYFVLEVYGFPLANQKVLSGLAAGIVLTVMVITGWMRLFFPSVRKRWVHLSTGFVLFFFLVLHTIFF